MHPSSTAHSELPDDYVYALPSIVEHLELSAMFPRQQPLEIELGSGDGSFLMACASVHPDRNFIGVERLLGRIRKLDRKGRRLGLRNLRGVRIESSYFLEYLLPPHCVSALHIYFPDPWPKLKHRRHRLVNERFPSLALRALTANGVVHLRTDDTDYFSQMSEVFAANDAFIRIEAPEELISLQTDFEKEFLASGKQTLRASYEARHFRD